MHVLIEEFRRLRDDDMPLLLSLEWSEQLENHKQFVLQDSEELENELSRKQFLLKNTHSADVQVC